MVSFSVFTARSWEEPLGELSQSRVGGHQMGGVLCVRSQVAPHCVRAYTGQPRSPVVKVYRVKKLSQFSETECLGPFIGTLETSLSALKINKADIKYFILIGKISSGTFGNLLN